MNLVRLACPKCDQTLGEYGSGRVRLRFEGHVIVVSGQELEIVALCDRCAELVSQLVPGRSAASTRKNLAEGTT